MVLDLTNVPQEELLRLALETQLVRFETAPSPVPEPGAALVGVALRVRMR